MFERVALIGIGLIGSSIARAARLKGLVERSGALIPEAWRVVLLGEPAADGSYSQTLNLRGGFIFSGLLPLGQLPPLF